MVEDSSDEEGVPTANKKIEWACFVCTTINNSTTAQCVTCRAPREYTKGLK